MASERDPRRFLKNNYIQSHFYDIGAAPTNTAASVGQRRPVGNGPQPLGGNFVSAGQNLTNKPMVQTSVQQQVGMQRQQAPPLQQLIQQQPLQQQPLQKQPLQQQPLQQQLKLQTPPVQRQQPTPQQLTPQQQQRTLPPQQQPSQLQANIPQQPKVVFKAEPSTPIPSVDKINANGNEAEEVGEDTGKKKPFWMKPGAGRVSKRERLRKRNERLRRILQPKNALMVLNELVGGTAYNVFEGADLYDGGIFKCVVTVDGREHVGTGKSKPGAKGAAAEAALKYLVLTRYKQGDLPADTVATADTVSGETEEKMDTTAEEGAGSGGISWSHVASYALHKLLTDWDEGTNLADRLSTVSQLSTPLKGTRPEKKPAKKLPENAATMNPIMLLNQMHPNAIYEDSGKAGNPPHVLFTVQCTVNGEPFTGSGPNKKSARKICAFGACIKVLGIGYTPEFLEENGVQIDASGNITTLDAKNDVAMQVSQVLNV